MRNPGRTEALRRGSSATARCKNDGFFFFLSRFAARNRARTQSARLPARPRFRDPSVARSRATSSFSGATFLPSSDRGSERMPKRIKKGAEAGRGRAGDPRTRRSRGRQNGKRHANRITAPPRDAPSGETHLFVVNYERARGPRLFGPPRQMRKGKRIVWTIFFSFCYRPPR